MAYLSNRTVNRVNLHYGIHSLAMGMGGIYVLVFLLRSGVSPPSALLAMALVVAGRFVVRPAVLPMARRLGLRSTLIAGTLGSALQYPILAEVSGVGPALLGFCALAAVGEAFYWSSYHAYFAALGDHDRRGQQLGAREALVAVVGIAAPLIGGWVLVELGPRSAFALTALVQVLAAAPLLGTPEVRVQEAAPGVYRAAVPAIRLFIADGWLMVMFLFVWQMSLFLTLGESFSTYGGAMALAALVGAAGGLVLGRWIDLGHGQRALAAAFGLVALTLIARSMSPGTPWLAVLANALGALAGCLYIPVLMTPVYNLALASPCPLRFHVATEGGWDLGCAAGCVVSAGLAAWGAPLAGLILLGLLGLAVSGVLLLRYYGAVRIVSGAGS